MPIIKFSPEVIGQFQSKIEKKWSYSIIISYFKKKNILVSKAYLSKISKNMKNPVKKSKKKKICGRKCALKPVQINKLEKLVSQTDPPTQRSMKIKKKRIVGENVLEHMEHSLKILD
jgi:hypothetical protein